MSPNLYAIKLISGDFAIGHLTESNEIILADFPSKNPLEAVTITNPVKTIEVQGKVLIAPFMEGTLALDETTKKLKTTAVEIPLNRVICYARVIDKVFIAEYEKLF